MKFYFLLLFILAFISCKNENKALSANQIVNKAIKKAGGENYKKAEISFVFRDNKYKSSRNCGLFSLQRITTDSLGTIKDILNNEGFSRYRNGELQKLPDSMETRYSNSVNSVHYFVQLPFDLNAPAVNKQLLGRDMLFGEPYYEIKVTFDQKDGGKDHEDVFLYWIHQKNFTVDYLAYRYETNGGGVRFREAYNPRTVNGIRFVDYKNFSPKSLAVKLYNLDSLFSAGRLKLFSKIETENIQVRLNDKKCE